MPNDAPQILVVDDNPTNLKLVAFILEKNGFAVQLAVDAQTALLAIEESIPSLILMDIQLPDTDGLSLTRALRERSELDDTVIIALTAYAMKGDDERAYEAGCNGYITKPIDTRAFPDQIRRFLAGSA